MAPVITRTRAWIVGLLGGALVILGACAAPPFDAAAVAQQWVAHMQRDYILQPGDQLSVAVYPHQDLAQEVRVAPNGELHLLRIPQPIPARGRSIGAVRKAIEEAYVHVVNDPQVSVALREVSADSVYVGGETRGPGVVAYINGMTLSQAIMAAGGFEITAKCSDVIVVRPGGQGKIQRFRVDMNEVFWGEGPDFLLLPGDVIMAQTSAIADAGNFVELYIRRLLPFQVTGVSVGGGGVGN